MVVFIPLSLATKENSFKKRKKKDTKTRLRLRKISLIYIFLKINMKQYNKVSKDRKERMNAMIVKGNRNKPDYADMKKATGERDILPVVKNQHA